MHWAHIQLVSDRFLATSQAEDDQYCKINEQLLAGCKVKGLELHKDILFKIRQPSSRAWNPAVFA